MQISSNLPTHLNTIKSEIQTRSIPLFINNEFSKDLTMAFQEIINSDDFHNEILALKLIQIITPLKIHTLLDNAILKARQLLFNTQPFRKNQFHRVEHAFRMIFIQNLAPINNHLEDKLSKQNPNLFEKLIDEREISKSALTSAIINPYLKDKIEERPFFPNPFNYFKEKESIPSLISNLLEHTSVGKIELNVLEKKIAALTIQEKQKTPDHWDILNSYNASTTRGKSALGVFSLGLLLGKYGSKISFFLMLKYAEYKYTKEYILFAIKLAVAKYHSLQLQIIDEGLLNEVKNFATLLKEQNLYIQENDLSPHKQLFMQFEPKFRKIIFEYKDKIQSIANNIYPVFEDHIIQTMKELLYNIKNPITELEFTNYLKEQIVEQVKTDKANEVDQFLANIIPIFYTILFISGIFILSSFIFTGINYVLYTRPINKKLKNSYYYQMVQKIFSYNDSIQNKFTTYLNGTFVYYSASLINSKNNNTNTTSTITSQNIITTFTPIFRNNTSSHSRMALPELPALNTPTAPIEPQPPKLNWFWNGIDYTENSPNLVLLDNRHGGKLWAFLDKKTLSEYEKNAEFIRLEKEFFKGKIVRGSLGDSGHKTLNPAIKSNKNNVSYTKEVKLIGLNSRLYGNPMRLPVGNDLDYIIVYDHFESKAH